MKWSTALTEKEYREQVSLIARRLSLCAREWFHEIAPVRLKMQARRFADSPERGKLPTGFSGLKPYLAPF
jgi:hypothetical protein